MIDHDNTDPQNTTDIGNINDTLVILAKQTTLTETQKKMYLEKD